MDASAPEADGFGPDRGVLIGPSPVLVVLGVVAGVLGAVLSVVRAPY